MSFATHKSRLHLANTSKDPDVLRSLMSDTSPEIRVACANRIKDSDDLKALACDSNGAVAWTATSTLNMQAIAYCVP